MVEDELAEAGMCLLDRRLAPETRRERLLGRARRVRARADLLHLVVVLCPAPARERRWPNGSELVRRVEAERPHVRQVGAERRRRQGGDPGPRDWWIPTLP